MLDIGFCYNSSITGMNLKFPAYYMSVSNISSWWMLSNDTLIGTKLRDWNQIWKIEFDRISCTSSRLGINSTWHMPLIPIFPWKQLAYNMQWWYKWYRVVSNLSKNALQKFSVFSQALRELRLVTSFKKLWNIRELEDRRMHQENFASQKGKKQNQKQEPVLL